MKQLLLKGFLNSLSLSVFITIAIVLCAVQGLYVPLIAFSLSLLVITTDTIDFYQQYKNTES